MFILQTFTEELNSPLSETQTTKSPWKETRDVEEKKQCPRCFESGRTKIQNYYTSFKSFLAKNDLSYFIEMSSRVFFPLTYIAFIAYFFGKYGIWRCALLGVSLAIWISYINWSSEDITSNNVPWKVHLWMGCGRLSEVVGDLMFEAYSESRHVDATVCENSAFARPLLGKTMSSGGTYGHTE